MKTATGYSGAQIALHWLTAVLILAAWLTGDGAEEALDTIREGGTAGFVPHVAMGLAVLALVLARILMRLGRGAPAAPGAPGSLAVLMADWGHRLIYLLMLAVPLAGGAMYFLGIRLGDPHELGANLLMLVVLGHALMALYHQYVLKDGLLRRMMKAG
ncbi:cytochrome b [Tabrizicola sp.]|uniref:cytochrome b n=1 Tax=Tabrizicola sp. TaxID=2005166 RepID=UPI0035AF583C